MVNSLSVCLHLNHFVILHFGSASEQSNVFDKIVIKNTSFIYVRLLASGSCHLPLPPIYDSLALTQTATFNLHTAANHQYQLWEAEMLVL